MTENPVDQYLDRLAAATQPNVRNRLHQVAVILSQGDCTDAREFAWEALTTKDATRLKRALAKRYRPTTANVTLSFFRGVVRQAWRMRLITVEDRDRLVDTGSVRGSSPPRGRHVPSEEVAQLLAACGDGVRGRRDALIVQLLYQAGLRRAEAAGLEVRAYDEREEEIRVRRGKGQKFRAVAVNEDLRLALAVYRCYLCNTHLLWGRVLRWLTSRRLLPVSRRGPSRTAGWSWCSLLVPTTGAWRSSRSSTGLSMTESCGAVGTPTCARTIDRRCSSLFVSILRWPTSTSARAIGSPTMCLRSISARAARGCGAPVRDAEP